MREEMTRMATATRAYTRDGSWRLLLETWRFNALVYNSIGATVHAQHWEEFTVWLFFKKGSCDRSVGALMAWM
jgi:hypothetical protein